MSPERNGLLEGHTNVQGCTLCFQPIRGWTIVVGVVAKGLIPDGETAFPERLTVTVDGTPYVLAVDVRSAWLGP